MKTEVRKISELIPDQRNVRLHDEQNLEAVRKSLERFGQQKPIVISPDGVVVAGNGTVAAAHKLGWTEVQVVVTSLHGKEATAYAVADNKTAELANWDYQLLGGVMEELQADEVLLGATGFSMDEIEPLLLSNWIPPDERDLEDHPDMAKSIKLTVEQREVFAAAVDRIRNTEADKEISEGRCVEFFAAEYLAGP